MSAGQLYAQSFNHWTRSFNEESSLLSGAVVGGGAGPSAIYYNPAAISEIDESKVSFHASLFSFKFYNMQNALGDGNHLKWSTIQIEPRFLSYMIKPKKHPTWSIELAFLNNENYQVNMAHSVDKRMDILDNFDGDERYFATFHLQNRFRDDWVGAGWSWNANKKLFLGASMFIMIRTNEYSYSLTMEAYPIDTANVVSTVAEYYTASYVETEYVKYNDYRLLWKFGILYKFNDRISIGASITTPSVGGIYSDGKRVSRRQAQSNITHPVSGEPLPDYSIADYKEKDAVRVNHKSPLSAALGLTWITRDGDGTFYSTAEYFGNLDTYKLVEADESPYLGTGVLSQYVDLNEWLTFVSGSKPILNAAVGYSWTIREQLRLMAGFRTDFNYIKGYNGDATWEQKGLKNVAVDNYHITGGFSWNVLGQDLITGLQYTIGRETGQRQIVNLEDPVEFNMNEMAPLQGDRSNNMSSMINSLSIYLGATFNFGGEN